MSVHSVAVSARAAPPFARQATTSARSAEQRICTSVCVILTSHLHWGRACGRAERHLEHAREPHAGQRELTVQDRQATALERRFAGYADAARPTDSNSARFVLIILFEQLGQPNSLEPGWREVSYRLLHHGLAFHESFGLYGI